MSIQKNPSQSLKPLPAQKMHKIVFSLLAVFGLVVLTYPLAMLRLGFMDNP